MDSLDEYLRGHIGVKGIPLSYVVRSEEAVDPSSDEPETSFLSVKDEMVARAPIIKGGLRTVTFNTDMMKVWGLISVITRFFTAGLISIQPGEQKMEGRPTMTCGTIYWDQIM